MFRGLLAVCAAAVAVGPSVSLAGPLDPAIVDPAAKWVVHADLEAVRASVVGGYFERIARAEASPFIDQIQSQFGLDPSTDILGVTVFGSDPGTHDGVAAVEMTAAADSLLRSIPAAGFTDFALLKFENGIEGWRWTMDGRGWYVARMILKPSRRVVLLAPSEARLISAVRVANARIGSTAAASTSPPGEGSMLFAAAMGLGQCPAFKPDATVLKQAQSFTFDLRETRSSHADPRGSDTPAMMRAECTVETRSPEDALKMEQMLRGVLAFSSLAASDSPELSKLVNGWSSSLTMLSEGDTFSLSMSYESGALIRMLEALQARSEAGRSVPRPPTRSDSDTPSPG